MRLILPQLGFGLIEAGLDRAVIQCRQQVASLDRLAFLDPNLSENAVDLRADDHAVQRQYRANPIDIARYILLQDLYDPHRHRCATCGFTGRRAIERPDAGTDQGNHQRAQQDFFGFIGHAG